MAHLLNSELDLHHNEEGLELNMSGTVHSTYGTNAVDKDYTILTTNLKNFISSKNIEPFKVYEKLISEITVTYYSCTPFGNGENGEHYGGTHYISFTFGRDKKYDCSYEETLTEKYGICNRLTINNIWFSTHGALIKYGTVSELLDIIKKWSNTFQYFIEICKDYKISLKQFLLIMGTIGDCFNNI